MDSERFFVPGEDNTVACGGCWKEMPAREQYGHFQSCDKAQNLQQVVKLARLTQARTQEIERSVKKEQEERRKVIERSERQKRRERERRGRDGRERGLGRDR